MHPKPLVILQHEPDDPPGSIGAALRDLGVPFEVRRLDEGDESARVAGRDLGHHRAGRVACTPRRRASTPSLPTRSELMRRIVHEGGPVWGVCLGAQLLAHRRRRQRLQAQEARGGLGQHREGRRRSVASRRLVTVRRLQLARVLVQRSGDLPPHRAEGRRRASVSRRREGLGDAVPPGGRRRHGASLGERRGQGAPRAGRGLARHACRQTPRRISPRIPRSATRSPRTSCSRAGFSPANNDGRVRRGRARTAALARRSRVSCPFPGSPSGRGACERSHGVVRGSTSTMEGCEEGDSSVHRPYYH